MTSRREVEAYNEGVASGGDGGGYGRRMDIIILDGPLTRACTFLPCMAMCDK